MMKCVCGHEEDEFIRFTNTHHIESEIETDYGKIKKVIEAYLYACPKCHTVKFDYN